MSRHPSPGPSQRTKSKPTMGITAGAEEVKYQAKYKELKRKVKEIEQDNEKLQFKVLQAKRNIQRMKLERAILYERLSAVPPSPEMNNNRPLPAAQPVPPPPPVRRSSANADTRQLPPLSHGHLPPIQAPPTDSPRSRQSYHMSIQHVNYSPPADRDTRSRRSHEAMSPHESSRVHNHQRLGPATYINRDPHERDRDRDIDWDRDRDLVYRQREPASHSPTVLSRSHYQEHHPAYYHDNFSATRVSRSDTPGSGSASGSAGVDVPSRPDSRGPYSYRLRPVEDSQQPPLDFVHEDGRTQSHQAQSRDRERERERDRVGSRDPASGHARKRTRSDAEMSMIDDSQAPAVAYPGAQRYHRGGGDNMEDVRMGPP